MRLKIVSVLAVLLTAYAVPAAASAAPLDPVCAEPFGQTDTPAHARVVRAVVEGTPVAVVLPVGYEHGRGRYPVLYLMHGAQGDEDSWIEYGGLLETTAARPAHEQAIVVLPRMGTVTGIAVDWVDGFRNDATLVGQTLVAWVDATFRTKKSRDHRAVAGYSGGGLSAAHVAERFPEVFGQLGVLSGAVDLRNPVSQPATVASMQAEKLCAGDDPLAEGPLGDPITNADAWAAADPLHGAARLAATRVWMSSGNGVPCRPEDAFELVYPTASSEPALRQQVDAFSAALTAAGVEHTNVHRPCGLHWWSTWRPDLDALWSVLVQEWRG